MIMNRKSLNSLEDSTIPFLLLIPSRRIIVAEVVHTAYEHFGWKKMTSEAQKQAQPPHDIKLQEAITRSNFGDFPEHKGF